MQQTVSTADKQTAHLQVQQGDNQMQSYLNVVQMMLGMLY